MGIVGLMKYPFRVEELPALLRRQSRGSDGNSGVMWSRSLGRVRGALGYPWVWQSRSKLGVRQVGSPCHRRHVACRCASPALSLGGKDKLAGETAGGRSLLSPCRGFSVLPGRLMQVSVQSAQCTGFPLPGILIYPTVGFFIFS